MTHISDVECDDHYEPDCTRRGFHIATASYHFVIAVWRAKEAECGLRRKYLLGVSLLVGTLGLRGIAQNSEETGKPSKSPDGKWEYRLLAPEHDQSVDQTPAIVKTDTDDVGVKLPDDGVRSFVQEANVVWAPDSNTSRSATAPVVVM